LVKYQLNEGVFVFELIEYTCRNAPICKHHEELDTQTLNQYRSLIVSISDQMSVLKDEGIFTTKVFMGTKTSTLLYFEITGVSDGQEHVIEQLSIPEEEQTVKVIINENIPEGDFILSGIQTGFRGDTYTREG